MLQLPRLMMKVGLSPLKLFSPHIYNHYSSYDFASGSEIMPCIKIDKPLVV